MIRELDKIISKLTVRLKDVTDNRYIGTGVIYCSDELKEKVYITTASHCLFVDGDDFQEQREEVFVDILQKDFIDYQSIKVAVNPDLLFKDKKKDIAILSIDKKEIENILGETPKIKVVKEKSIYKSFIVKGFPQATFGEEIAVLYPDWLQTIDTRFQLQLKEDYTAYNTKGFSGSGVFINAEKDIFLYGIFTRFRAEEKGKVIYSQFLDITNELLTKNYLPLIRFTYFGGYGLTQNFFRKQIETSITGLGSRFSEELNFQLPHSHKANPAIQYR